MNTNVDLKQEHYSILLVYKIFSRKRTKPQGGNGFTLYYACLVANTRADSLFLSIR